MTLRVAQFFLKIAHLSFSMGPRGPRAYCLRPRLWLLIIVRVSKIPTHAKTRECLLSRGSVKPRLHERFFACDGDAIFWKIVVSPARGEYCMYSHPRTDDATDEKIAEKNREKFNELIFLRQNHGLCQRVVKLAIFAARWRRDNFKKIASTSQAKNRSCSRRFTPVW